MPCVQAQASTVSRERRFQGVFLLIVLAGLGLALRLSYLAWQEPWTPHHPDEHILPAEAVALWEGVTPREVGWPASTTRLALSGLAAARWVVEDGSAVWAVRGEPGQMLERLARWIGHQIEDPAGMYQLSRALSLATGVSQLLLLWWALGRWTGRTGQAVGTLAAAVSPVAILHSQYVLADITGLLFATALIGVAARPDRRAVLMMGGLAGLAAASKLHFGIWLLAPLAASPGIPRTRGLQQSRNLLMAMTLTVFAGTMLLLVPWWLIDPFVAIKELAGVMGPKLDDPDRSGAILTKLSLLFGSTGWLCWFGGLLGLAALRRATTRVMVVLLPTALASLALLAAPITFDRYALVLMPGVLVLAALGWERVLTVARPRVRTAGWVVAASCLVLTSRQLVQSQRNAGEISVDVAAAQWITAHVPIGGRIALHNEWSVPLPRSAAALRACAEQADGGVAYREKWRALGWAAPDDVVQPMAGPLLTDERFAAYLCRRELGVRQDAGYTVVPYHDEPRFGAIPEADAIDAYLQGSTGPDAIDVLVLSHSADLPEPPAQVVRTSRGQRVIYMRR